MIRLTVSCYIVDLDKTTLAYTVLEYRNLFIKLGLIISEIMSTQLKLKICSPLEVSKCCVKWKLGYYDYRCEFLWEFVSDEFLNHVDYTLLVTFEFLFIRLFNVVCTKIMLFQEYGLLYFKNVIYC